MDFRYDSNIVAVRDFDCGPESGEPCPNNKYVMRDGCYLGSPQKQEIGRFRNSPTAIPFVSDLESHPNRP